MSSIDRPQENPTLKPKEVRDKVKQFLSAGNSDAAQLFLEEALLRGKVVEEVVYQKRKNEDAVYKVSIILCQGEKVALIAYRNDIAGKNEVYVLSPNGEVQKVETTGETQCDTTDPIETINAEFEEALERVNNEEKRCFDQIPVFEPRVYSFDRWGPGLTGMIAACKKAKRCDPNKGDEMKKIITKKVDRFEEYLGKIKANKENLRLRPGENLSRSDIDNHILSFQNDIVDYRDEINRL